MNLQSINFRFPSRYCIPNFPILAGLLVMSIFCSAGCFSSKVSHVEKVSPTTLEDFAGTYQNTSVPRSNASLVDILWPKRPQKPQQGTDYRDINKVRIDIQGKTATVTFLSGDKIYGQVRYLEGKDFNLKKSVVPLKTQSDAAATIGGSGGREMAGMLPVPPVAGAALVRGQLFLNKHRDLVVRTDGVTAMLIFFAVPVVMESGNDYVFKRMPDTAG